ncbi:MAG: GGDEF domain-containing protein [Pseudomonadota bacterium]
MNDTFGHSIGDSVLRHTVALCKDHLRPGDLFGRLGGEEFGMLLLGCDQDQAVEIANRIRLAIETNPIELEEQQMKVPISASFGVASSSNLGFALQRLLRRADAALYRAKGSGRNSVNEAADEQAVPNS